MKMPKYNKKQENIQKIIQPNERSMSNLCVEGDEHMFRIAICDDERQFRKRIHDILIE